ncbi:hypothetical protein [Streptomyces sp. SID8385]|uniref:hypothetical protein n=1 Tax=Streptomyces sp. SID8385 TaxID=2690364 RepID=UPI0013610F09|nr:hypothetical protein [Streptomyces sp. SID8385]
MYRRWSGAAGAVVLAVLLTGCGGETALDSDRKAAVPEASAESSPSAPTNPRPTEERAVLAAYEGMWRELAVAVQKPSAGGTRIEDYASGEALATVRRDVRTMREAGTRANGRLGHEPEVTKMDPGASPPTATVRDCVDLKDWETTRDGTPVPLPSGQPMRYRTTAQVEQWDDGRWRVITYTQHGEQAC